MSPLPLFAATEASVAAAISTRNNAWVNNPAIPPWVKIHKVGLDRFFTDDDLAADCFNLLIEFMQTDHANINDYCFVEPAAGKGAFYNLLPKERRVGIDILPDREEVLQQDFLSWKPEQGRKYAVIGNPPFGYRGWLALAFISHASTFADYIGMILPMSFQGDGKGSPKNRVVGAELRHTEPLSERTFVDDGGSPLKINAVWQIWRRGVNNLPPPNTCDTWVEVFTVDTSKNRRCGFAKMDEADWFLQRTYFGEIPPNLVSDFLAVEYGIGYGIIIKRDKKQITEALLSTDWNRYSNLAAHNCRHISLYHIRQALTDAGFVDT